MESTTRRLQIKYNSEFHQINVKTLLNSLFNITGILEEINQELNIECNTYRKINMNIKAFPKGSFNVDLDIINAVSQAADFFSHADIHTAQSIVQILIDLLRLKKLLRGKKPKEVEEKDDKITIKNDDNAKITVDQRTFNIYANNVTVNASINKNFENLANDDEISGLEIGDEKSTQQIDIDGSDFNSLSSENELLEENTKEIIIKEARCTIIKIVFEENRKWQFYYEGNKISAYVNDEHFMKQVEKGENFSKGDVLICKLKIHQLFDESVNTFINRDYEIIEVLDHIRVLQQRNIGME